METCPNVAALHPERRLLLHIMVRFAEPVLSTPARRVLHVHIQFCQLLVSAIPLMRHLCML